ncbi:MAG TPA: MBOAT family protein, partial [Cyclobacteriaceae bacterium]|nr:MBOAT family protein [Cyclobacteriaceae bacterium]
MLFGTYEFLFIFLPVTLIVYFLLAEKYFYYAKAWLIAASLFFYAYWNPINVLIIISVSVVNFFLAKHLIKTRSRVVLTLGIVANLTVLGYYKYADFFIFNLNLLTGQNISLLHIVLPLGISFFTFQKIALLVDSYQGKVAKLSFSDFCLFATFFPQLLAGPIVHHAEMMPQFA